MRAVLVRHQHQTECIRLANDDLLAHLYRHTQTDMYRHRHRQTDTDMKLVTFQIPFLR